MLDTKRFQTDYCKLFGTFSILFPVLSLVVRDFNNFKNNYSIFKLLPNFARRLLKKILHIESNISTVEEMQTLFTEAQATSVPITGQPSDENLVRLREALLTVLSHSDLRVETPDARPASS